jgi:hypothetical protein
MNKRRLSFVILILCVACGVTLFAAVTASGLVRTINVTQKQSPVGEMQYIFTVQVTETRFGAAGGTCKFYVELKDASGKHYFGASRLHQSMFHNSGGYAVTYTFPVNIGGIDRPGIVAYAAELELENVVLNTYKQSITDLEQWKAACASYDKLTFGRLSYQNH